MFYLVQSEISSLGSLKAPVVKEKYGQQCTLGKLFCFLSNAILFIYLSIYLFIYLFIYLWLCLVFVSVRGLSLVVPSGVHSSSQCAGLLLSWPLVAEHRLQTRRLSSYGSRA